MAPRTAGPTRSSVWLLSLVLSLATEVLGAGCSPKRSVAPPASTTDPNNRECSGTAETISSAKEPKPDVTCKDSKREILCYGQWAAQCGLDNKLVKLTNCRAKGEVCAMRDCASDKDCDGCRACTPSSVLCGDGGARMICREDGSGYDPADNCDESQGMRCSLASGMCEDLCARAREQKSYIGCDYYAVATSNQELAFQAQDADGLCQPFTFGVVVANSEGVPATVTVQSPEQAPRSVVVGPSEAKVIELPCSPELKGDLPGEPVFDPDASITGFAPRYTVQAKAAAHHLTSDVPVTVYQFNPLEFQSMSLTTGKNIYSYTNDASLLLPTNSLTGDYVVMAWPSLMQSLAPPGKAAMSVTRSGPGFAAIVGADDKPVEVEIESSAYTLPSEDGTVPALAPGDHYSFTLAPGDVFQLLSATPDDCNKHGSDGANGLIVSYCDVGKDYDLTGTHIHSEGKLEVIAGHDCAFVPFNRWACDHLEEIMFPSESWGREVIVSITTNVSCESDLPNIVRVLSSADGNRITFSPDVHASVTLDKGQFVEFEFTEDFVVSASAAIMVAQYLVGQEYKGVGSAAPLAKGDPSLSLAIPTEQFRSNYPFLIPATYTDNFVNIIARTDQLVLIDERVVSGFTTIKGTNVAIARLGVDPGEHVAKSSLPFGIVIYGYAPFTSYMMPGGLDLQPITHVF